MKSISKNIKEIRGNLLTLAENGEFDCIMHVVNSFGVMGSGIALSIKKKYPFTFENYENLCKGSSAEDLLGDNLMVWEKSLNGKDFLISNIFAMHSLGGDGRNLNYEAFYSSIGRMLEEESQEFGIISFGCPKLMGCDRAGGDWNVVQAMLVSLFGRYEKMNLVIVDWDNT